MATARPFVMHGAREILDISSGDVRIEHQIKALESAVADSPNLAFDLSRSLVECVCKTILGDRGQADCDKLDFKDLLERTYNEVRLVPESHAAETELIESIDRILSNLDNVVFGLSDLRHREGLASHGKDGFASSLEAIQAQLSARAADTVAYFLFMAHKNYPDVPRCRNLEFDDNPDFNEFVDQNNGPVEIFDLVYTPSEVLFSIDVQAYLDKLTSFRSEEGSAKEDTDDELEGDPA